MHKISVNTVLKGAKTFLIRFLLFMLLFCVTLHFYLCNTQYLSIVKDNSLQHVHCING